MKKNTTNNYRVGPSTWAACLLLFLMFSFIACKKFLDKKSDNSLAIPSTIQDAQALLNNYTIFNTFYSSVPSQSDDDYFLDDAYFNTISVDSKNNYTWGKEAYNQTQWTLAYNIVYYANIALDAINKMQPGSYLSDYNDVKGQALFFRGYAFFNLAQQWAPPYNATTSTDDAGIPMRLNSDPNVPSARASVDQTYKQIIKDLTQASSLLPVQVPVKSRPSKAAAFAALARVYLSMRQYADAFRYADSSLRLYNTLIDYNTISKTSAIPFQRFNAEVILQTQFLGTGMLSVTNWKVDSNLFDSYNSNDLRKTLFYKANGTNTYGFKGSYNGITSGAHFNGLAVDELYLTLAECSARAGDKDAAMNYLNTLLEKRWVTGAFLPYSASDADEALERVLAERRKELVGRGLRWLDLRRLNFEPAFAKTLKRKVDGNTYELLPLDMRYTFYIPARVIELTGMPQNVR